MVTRRRLSINTAAGIVLIPAVVVVALVKVCEPIVEATGVVLELISRSL